MSTPYKFKSGNFNPKLANATIKPAYPGYSASMSTPYKLKSVDFNSKAADHTIKTAIPGYAALMIKKNDNRNSTTIEPIKHESVIAHRISPPPKLTKQNMKNRKLSYFSSIVE